MFRCAAAWITTLAVAIASPAEEKPGALGIYRFPADLAVELGMHGGAAVFHVVPRSPADRAGLQPGDIITGVQKRRIANFDELLTNLENYPPGESVDLTYRRNGKEDSTTATLARRAQEIGDAGLKRTLEFLKSATVRVVGPAVPRETADAQWKLGERTNALKTLEAAANKLPTSAPVWDFYLDTLHKNGRYSEYVEKATIAAAKMPDESAIQRHGIEALLAMGRLEEAEERAARLADRYFAGNRFNGSGADIHALWADVRIRQGKPLSDPRRPATLANWKNPQLEVIKTWRDTLDGAKPYERVRSESGEINFQTSSVMLGFIPNRMHGITITINGVDVPLAIVDTGASHTLIANDIAELAKVQTAGAKRGAHGSLNFTAQAGLIRELKIGPMVFRNVPVSVGNPPPLAMTKAKAALGLDLMHQIRFTLDYARGRALVEPAESPAKDPVSGKPWDIPLFTFSDHTLAEGKLSSGASARVLIDSGNFAQTLLWPTWGKDHVAGHKGPARDMFAFATNYPTYKIKDLTIGGRTLPPWPVMDMPPVTLQGVDLIDLLMGHDLLSQYRTTIDMKARRLRLETPGGDAKPAEAPPGIGD